MTRGRILALAAVLLTLLLAGGVSYYASDKPDGLEAAAEESGFADRGDESPAAASPFADYETDAVDSAPVSNATAGLAGVALVGALMVPLTWWLRRKPPRPEGG